jgi:acyl transferase domain-containing protein
MRTALDRSGHRPEDIGYLEVNGSGSVVTDLLELKAIQAVYRETERRPLWLGSMKPNIGHPLCAEGIAGFIKTVLTLERAQAVPFLSGEQAMGHFDLAAASFVLPRELTVWRDLHRVAALNCFADGGTNVHVILESWEPAADAGPTRTPKPMPVLYRRPLFGPRDQAKAGEHRNGKGHENGNGHASGMPVTMPSPMNPKPTNRWRQVW